MLSQPPPASIPRVSTRLGSLLEKGIRLKKETQIPKHHFPGFLQPQMWLLFSVFGGFLISQRAPELCPWPFSLASQYIRAVWGTPSRLMVFHTMYMLMIQRGLGIPPNPPSQSQDPHPHSQPLTMPIHCQWSPSFQRTALS